MSEVKCCQDFARAFEEETDNEGYDPLVYIRYETMVQTDNLLRIGYGLKPIQFCPWCGKKVQEVPE